MAFDGSRPPYKKQRIVPQSLTDISYTPSPPITPRSNHNSSYNTNSIKRLPHVDSTPIRNYFARFTDNTQSRRQQRDKMRDAITPRALWKKSEKIIPFPPSQFIEKETNDINIDCNKYDTFYHPLMDIIKKRKNLNVFSKEFKTYYDDEPFLDPDLQIKMRDNLFKLLCDINDNNNNYDNNDDDDDIDKASEDVLQMYGDDAITNVLQNVNDTEFDIGNTDIDRAQQFIEYLRSDSCSSSYDEMKNGMVFLSGVLQYITSIIVDNAAFIAEYNNSLKRKRIDDKYKKMIRNDMDKYSLMLTPYDEDVFNYDINRNGLIITPLHVRHAIADDNALFWLQQSICMKRDNASVDGIEDELNKDCVYHICSFFRGDLPMLSSLARVNTTFYVMTSNNNLWKPIAIRCFLFNPQIIQQIEDNYNDDNDDCYDFRSFISLSQHIKLIVLRERWIKQRMNDDNKQLFEVFVRINPVYDLNTKMYKLLYIEDDDDIDLYVDHEIYDLFGQILEIFGTINDDITITQIINNVKCLNYNQIKGRFTNIFDTNLNEIIEIEYDNNNNNNKEVLFIELPLNQNCFQNNKINDKHYLWIGANIVVSATFPCHNVQIFQ